MDLIFTMMTSQMHVFPVILLKLPKFILLNTMGQQIAVAIYGGSGGCVSPPPTPPLLIEYGIICMYSVYTKLSIINYRTYNNFK